VGSWDGTNAGEIYADHAALGGTISGFQSAGWSLSISAGYIRGDGFDIAITTGQGIGYDKGGSWGITLSKYSGYGEPSWSNFSGHGEEYSAGFIVQGSYSIGLEQKEDGSFSPTGWKSYSVGGGFGKPSLGFSYRRTYTYLLSDYMKSSMEAVKNKIEEKNEDQ
jgi:hypothetical protein